MTVDHTGRPFSPGETSGSPQRAPHHLDSPVQMFDLASEVERLRAEESWRRNRRNARTLVKELDFRVVLVALQDGARLEEHRAPGRISIHTVQGHARVRVHGAVVDLPAGHLLTLEQNIAHDVTAQGDSAFLLTIAWPSGVDIPATAGDAG